MKSVALLAAILSSIPCVASADAPPIIGTTRADEAAAHDFRRGVQDLVRVLGHCETVSEIRTTNAPSDFIPPPNSASHTFELWTGIGCGKQFPVIVEWTVGPNGYIAAGFWNYGW